MVATDVTPRKWKVVILFTATPSMPCVLLLDLLGFAVVQQEVVVFAPGCYC